MMRLDVLHLIRYQTGGGLSVRSMVCLSDQAAWFVV
jgi:hypothetical protein